MQLICRNVCILFDWYMKFKIDFMKFLEICTCVKLAPARLKKLWNTLSVIICFPQIFLCTVCRFRYRSNCNFTFCLFTAFYRHLYGFMALLRITPLSSFVHACLHSARLYLWSTFGKFEINVKFSRCWLCGSTNRLYYCLRGRTVKGLQLASQTFYNGS